MPDEEGPQEGMSQGEPAGNTDPAGSTPAKRPSNQLYRWFFTLKSDPHNSPEYMSQLSQLYRVLGANCKEFYFQLEKGEKSEYEHFQGVISLKTKHRLPEVKNLLGYHTIHLEPIKNWWKGKEYCTKVETRLAGPWSHNRRPVKPKIAGELRGWQKELVDLINSEPDDRSIHIYHDASGLAGKSSIGIHLFDTREDIIYAPSGKNEGVKETVVRGLNQGIIRAIIFNYPRDFRGRPYWSFMEELKDGYVLNTRYATESARFDPPHVIVFTNEETDFEGMKCIFSEDRIKIHKL
jgi:hypothetical protein